MAGRKKARNKFRLRARKKLANSSNRSISPAGRLLISCNFREFRRELFTQG
jgi:hypothetical protein